MNMNPGRTDKYELHELLRRDGRAEVWKAFDTEARRYVAIKFLNANAPADLNFVTRFQQETLAIAALHHPNIIQYYDFAILQSPTAGGTKAALVMNYVDGGTLADYIQNTSRKGKFLSTGDIVRLFTIIATAVGYAHEQGMVHGQLKPTNILLDKRNTARHIVGEPVITDFGIYKLLAIVAGSGVATGTWESGPPIYTSPEQITGSPPNERSDIYSLGIMLYEICTGIPPFQGNNQATVMMQHINTMPTSPALINPGVSSALTAIIMRCIAKEPWMRFSSAAALIEALAQVEGNETASVPATQSIAGNASQLDSLSASMDMPTILTRSPQPGMYTPAPPSISGFSFAPLPPTLSSPGIGGQGDQPSVSYATPVFRSVGSSQPYPTIQQYGQVPPMPPAAPVGPVTPMPPTLIPVQPAQGLPSATHPQPPVSAPSRRRRRPLLWAALAVLLILVVAGSSLGSYFLFFSKGHSSTPTTSTGEPQIVGHAYFVSSGLLLQNSTRGITDQLQIHLDNIAAPPAGKAYYAWLLNDIAMQWSPLYLGRLTVNNRGAVDFSYPGDTANTNLLANNSRLLITEDDAASTPVSPDSGTNVYYAAFPQIPHAISKTLSFSLYDHLRHLLSAEPGLNAAGLTGGLDTWLYHNSQKILEWAGSARDATFAGSENFIRNQLTRIMCYLDGAPFIQHDLPQANCSDPTVGVGGKIGLLTLPLKGSFGFLKHITIHLDELTKLPEATPQQRALAAKIFVAINVVNQRFTVMRDDALQLLRMPPAQWSQPAGISLLDTIATLANDAFVGKADPQGNITDGVALINYDIQGLATFNVTACPCVVK